ncbi:hypothetical protein ABZ499_27535 [Streptomyces sp. NPDC019990]|uniref:hypothetical protein n=1 Tax=Streptomyces sp. NPDC019990 TaxID=3154693 RepID=UPI0034078E76
MAAIGSVIFTGIATYYGAEVAEQQLEQAQEDSEKEDREQARTFSFWTENVTRNRLQLHVQNRSPDPIPRATVYLFGVADGHVGPSAKNRAAIVLVTITGLGPCTKLTYEISPMSVPVMAGHDPVSKKSLPFLVDRFWAHDAISASFIDRDGRKWTRTGDGLEPWKPKLPPAYEKFMSSVSYEKPKEKKAVACEASP